MTKTTTIAAAAAALALGASAVPAGAAAPAPTPDTTTGTGYSAAFTSFTFTVREALGTAKPAGSASFVNPFFKGAERDRSGGVVCAKIEGDRAIFGIKDTTPAGAIRYLLFYVHDVGTPAASGPGVDRLGKVGTSNVAPPQDCGRAFPRRGRGGVIISGNIVVKDLVNGDDTVAVR